jgi:DNA-binding NtrC family response regulator
MDIRVQPKLLKVLEEKRFRRLGDVRERHLDVRLIAASHQDLGQLVREKRFRSDLYFRVSTVVLRMPALRERMEDIPVLARFFFERAAIEIGRPNLRLPSPIEEKLTAYNWPGNVRELKNVMERAALLATGDTIRIRDLHLEFGNFGPQAGVESPEMQLQTLSEMENHHIRRMLQAEKGNIARAAVRLGIARSSLYNKIKTYGINSIGRSDSTPPAGNAPSSAEDNASAAFFQ